MGCDQLQVVEDFSFNMKNNNILSRNSSVGCSSRIYYYRSDGTVGIPFQWEMQPGTPKDQPSKEEALPPLSPPPAVLSLGLPKPCISDLEPCKPRRRLIRFWKKIKKNDHLLKITNYKKSNVQNNNVLNGVSHDYKEERFEFCGSDCEFMSSSSPARNSSSSSSLSLSFSRESSRLQSPAWHPPSRLTLNCSPWNITTVLVSLAKRF